MLRKAQRYNIKLLLAVSTLFIVVAISYFHLETTRAIPRQAITAGTPSSCSNSSSCGRNQGAEPQSRRRNKYRTEDQQIVASLNELKQILNVGGSPVVNKLRRSADLTDLARLMNGIPSSNVPERIDDEGNYTTFMKRLLPWIVAEGPAPSRSLWESSKNADPWLSLDCDNIKYKSIYGRTIPSKAKAKVIVDLVLFGYDFDLLEVRLLETYDLVDLFIIYEAPYTLRGMPKPFYFQESVRANPKRWDAYAEKIVYIAASEDDLEVARGIVKGPETKISAWALYELQHRLPVEIIKESRHPMIEAVKGSLETAYIVQSDGDELITRVALRHFKYCKLRPRISPPFYAPCFAFKHNFEWPQRGVGEVKSYGLMKHWINDGIIARDKGNQELFSYLWEAGPLIYLLKDVLDEGHLGREGWRTNASSAQLGIGAAVHLSNLASPEYQWLKAGSTVDSVGVPQAFSPELLEAVRLKVVSPEFLGTNMMIWCSRNSYANHISTLPTLFQNLVAQAIPKSALFNAARYPFLIPPRDSLRCSWAPGITRRCSWTSSASRAMRPDECIENYLAFDFSRFTPR